MDAALVNNPDGSAAVVVAVENPRTRPPRVYPPIETQSNPSSKIQTNPFPEQDRVAMQNLQMMQKQDAAAWAEHEAADSVSSMIIDLNPLVVCLVFRVLSTININIFHFSIAGAFELISTRCSRYSISRDLCYLQCTFSTECFFKKKTGRPESLFSSWKVSLNNFYYFIIAGKGINR